MPVIFNYLYRDADNYKSWGTRIFRGTRFPGDLERLQAATEDGEHFVATQVGLTPQQPGMISFPSPADHGYHEIPEDETDIEEIETYEGADLDPRTWAEFLAEFEAVGPAGWDAVKEAEDLGILT